MGVIEHLAQIALEWSAIDLEMNSVVSVSHQVDEREVTRQIEVIDQQIVEGRTVPETAGVQQDPHEPCKIMQ